MKLQAIKKIWPYGALLGLFILISLALLLHNVSPYNIYPDSYQNTTVAQNLKTSHRLVAPMGQHGLVYPDFFGWTRPMYPILIVIFSWFGLSLFSAAHTINVIAGLLCILVVYALVSAVLC
jgi:hypothetical protein